jgi:hypothetical protein
MMISSVLYNLVRRPRDVRPVSIFRVEQKEQLILNSLSPSRITTSFRPFTPQPSMSKCLRIARATSSAPCDRVNRRRGRMIEKFVLPISCWSAV